MQTDKELFDLIKESFPIEPSEDFVSATETKLRQSARKLSRKRTYKRLIFAASGFLVFSFAVSWFFFLNGKEVVNNALTSLGEYQSTESEKHKDLKKNNPVVKSADNENQQTAQVEIPETTQKANQDTTQKEDQGTTQKENQDTTQNESQETAQKALQVKDENGKVYATAYFPTTMDVRFEPTYTKIDKLYVQKIYVTQNGTEYDLGTVFLVDASMKSNNYGPYIFLKEVDDKIILANLGTEIPQYVYDLKDPAKTQEFVDLEVQLRQILINMK